MIARPLTAVTLAALLACSSSSSPSTSGNDGQNTGAPGTVGDLCSSTSPCASGLTCAQTGSLAGRCTADCSANLDLCTMQFGANTVCMNASTCARVCTSAAQCPGSGDCVSLSGGQSACITPPNGPPGAPPPPNGACYNFGGTFGDTVENGGYRCSPTANGMIGTGIDQCKNGNWVSAFNCTCMVTSSISGTQNPSQCFDFEMANTARCEYAVDYCEQCDPLAGCQAH